MDPFHVVALAAAKLDNCRQRLQQQLLGRRGRAGDPLYRVRRVLRTRTTLPNSRQRARLHAAFAADGHAPVQVTPLNLPANHRRLRRPRRGKALLTRVIDTISAGVPGQARRARHARADPAPAP